MNYVSPRLWQVVLVLLFYTFSSCVSTNDTLSSLRIEKRRYSKGYHIDVLKKANRAPLPEAKQKSSFRLEKTSSNNDWPPSIDGQTFTENSKEDNPAIDDEECADVITYKSGKSITVKVVDIDEDDITFKKCNDLKGANYVVKKSSVRSIKYADGDIDTFEDNRESSIAGSPKATDYTPFAGGEPKNSGFATLSLVFGIIGILSLSLYFLYPIGLVLGGIAFISGLIGIITIMKSKGRKLGLMKAWLGMVAGLGTTIIVLILNYL